MVEGRAFLGTPWLESLRMSSKSKGENDNLKSRFGSNFHEVSVLGLSTKLTRRRTSVVHALLAKLFCGSH